MIAVNKRLGPDDLLRNPLETRGRQEIRFIRGCSRVFAILNIVAGQWRLQLRPPFTKASSSVNALLEDATLMTLSRRNR
jgi:hypothetical protein